MKLYCGIDLHSNSHLLILIDKHVETHRPDDLLVTIKTLKPHRAKITTIAIESAGWSMGQWKPDTLS
ncbi:MAG: hypothetical protein ACYDAE_05050 [Steroidobacteraceae bacterium]